MKPACPVYIVDHDSKTRQYLVGALRREGFEPTPFSCGADFVGSLDFLAPGIALLELRLSDRDGMAVQEEILSRRLDIPLIMMSMSSDIPTAVDVIKRGAVDFLEKPFADSVLFKMLANVQPVLEQRIEIQRRRDVAAAQLESLTKRERDVVRALGSNSSNRDVADALQISVRTVEMHRASIMKKFGVKKFSEIILALPESGLPRS
ncbi:response regulator transcription factor [Sphingobium chlorophenolicum]|uniref:Two component transcriptional regulator, LuxR family n=1 Tax=Sphingobium chlorophenolicum TaxID=46429 RepID=A0A081REQ2_SPHCR|nr:response regulator [Sphingobium chlorophenolicum]KEQ53675.1 Two component transcriptional regulator, LuxR family [Sphingobium chlorophenolicum]